MESGNELGVSNIAILSWLYIEYEGCMTLSFPLLLSDRVP